MVLILGPRPGDSSSPPAPPRPPLICSPPACIIYLQRQSRSSSAGFLFLVSSSSRIPPPSHGPPSSLYTLLFSFRARRFSTPQLPFLPYFPRFTNDAFIFSPQKIASYQTGSANETELLAKRASWWFEATRTHFVHEPEASITNQGRSLWKLLKLWKLRKVWKLWKLWQAKVWWHHQTEGCRVELKNRRGRRRCSSVQRS